MPRQRQRRARTWTTTSRGRACGGARAQPTPTSHGSRATTACAPTTARAAATSSAMHPSQATVAACEGKHLPGVNGSPPHLAPRTTVLCARGAGRALVMGRNHAVVDRHEGSSGGVQGTKRAIGGAPGSELAMNNGPFPEKWPRTMAHSNQWAKEMGHFPKNGLEEWPISEPGANLFPLPSTARCGWTARTRTELWMHRATSNQAHAAYLQRCIMMQRLSQTTTRWRLHPPPETNNQWSETSTSRSGA